MGFLLHKFAHFVHALRLFKALRLFFLTNFPCPTVIPCPTSIQDSRVVFIFCLDLGRHSCATYLSFFCCFLPNYTGKEARLKLIYKARLEFKNTAD